MCKKLLVSYTIFKSLAHTLTLTLSLHGGNLSGKFSRCGENCCLSMGFTAWFYVKGNKNLHFGCKNYMGSGKIGISKIMLEWLFSTISVQNTSQRYFH
jgi:hypothetical protein